MQTTSILINSILLKCITSLKKILTKQTNNQPTNHGSMYIVKSNVHFFFLSFKIIKIVLMCNIEWSQKNIYYFKIN